MLCLPALCGLAVILVQCAEWGVRHSLRARQADCTINYCQLLDQMFSFSAHSNLCFVYLMSASMWKITWSWK
uniref:Secreted protein n=1 Tax=Physcomitrium patens TaxID=3218 RepID=A0A2K1JMR1_PHYPA|nr:hypothetical protein PHYPA_017506 [Physcomitrium patens]